MNNVLCRAIISRLTSLFPLREKQRDKEGTAALRLDEQKHTAAVTALFTPSPLQLGRGIVLPKIQLSLPWRPKGEIKHNKKVNEDLKNDKKHHKNDLF